MIDELARELVAVGFRGRLRARILAEADDHVHSDPEGAAHFGEPREIANAFAAELGTQASRRVATRAFVALGIAGAVYAAAFIGAAVTSHPSVDSASASLALMVVVVAPQVSFVSGSLALLRALRLRRSPVLPTAELTTINRRTAVALVSGLAAMAGLVAYALALRSQLPSWLVAFTTAGALAAALPIVLVTIPAASAARLRPRVAGTAGDVFDDLGLAPTSPWRFARRVAAAVGFVVWLQAAVQGDPLDGLVIGLFEAVACLSGFALFGKYLGLRR